MPLKDDVLQTLLTRAQADLKTAEKQLEGVPGKKNAMWRRANSRVKQIEGRLKTRTDIRTGKLDKKAAAEEPEEKAE